MDFIEQTFETLNQAIPDEVNQLILDSVEIAQIFPINQNERINSQILKADEFVFQPGASLTFTDISFPYIVVIAKKWKFVDISQSFSIGFDRTIQAYDGRDGQSGRNGQNGQGEVNRRGNDGQNGENGQDGENGGFLTVPHIYLIAEEFICNDVNQDIDRLKFVLDFRGIEGGDGGDGGNGGNGGQGADGKEGATQMFDCHEGAGQGGTGGTSGAGGKGGDAGRGTDGSTIYLIGKENVSEILSYSKINNYGGRSGRSGRSGRPGKSGKPGNGGGGRGWCSPGPRGNYGQFPDPADFGDGIESTDGEKGNVYKIKVNRL